MSCEFGHRGHGAWLGLGTCLRLDMFSGRGFTYAPGFFPSGGGRCEEEYLYMYIRWPKKICLRVLRHDLA